MKMKNNMTEELHVKSIEVATAFRCLEVGFKFEPKLITLLVGDQGSGKSSLLEMMHQVGQGKKSLNIVLSDKVKTEGIQNFYFDAEKHNPRLKDPQLYSQPDGKDKGIGYVSALKSRFKSHGEVMQEFTVKAIRQASNAIVLLDEPESGLSLRNQFKLITEIQAASKRGVQFFIATHCLPLIQSMDEVYSMENRQWMKSSDFIAHSQLVIVP
jgi:predicted ATPase